MSAARLPSAMLVVCAMACTNVDEASKVPRGDSVLIETPDAVAAAQERGAEPPAAKADRPRIASPSLGQPISQRELAAWNINVFPDGSGLPAGSGTAAQGKTVYENNCIACHGVEGKAGVNQVLVGGIGSLSAPEPKRTIASYWMYATTIFDYVRRAMPYHSPKKLSDEEVYAVVAYVLNLNGIIGADDVMNAKTLPKVKMPNADSFIAIDAPHPDTFIGAKR